MTPARGATEVLSQRPQLEFVVDALTRRAYESNLSQDPAEAERLRDRVRDRSRDLLDAWSTIAHELRETGGMLQYQEEVGGAQRLLYEFLNPALKTLPARHKNFRANRSMRDVEPSVNLWLATMDDIEIETEEQP